MGADKKKSEHSGKSTPRHHKKDHTSEITKRSLLDLVNDNFKLANRTNYVHRMVYIADHNFETEADASDVLKTTIDRINKEYSDEKLTGVVVYYRNQFCHMLEGSECVLMDHLEILHDKSLSRYIKRSKLLVFVHNINQRFFKDWEWYMGQPSILVEDIDPNSDLENSVRYINNAIERLHKFAAVFSKNIYKIEDDDDSSSSEDSGNFKPMRSLSYTTNVYREFLPENKLLDFLLSTRFLDDLKHFHGPLEKTHQRPGEFDGRLWPIPTDYIPYNVFDKPYVPMETGIIKTGDSTMDIRSSTEVHEHKVSI